MKCPNLHCLHSLSGALEACPNCGLPLPGSLLGERFKLDRVESASATAVRFLARDGDTQVRVRVYLASQEQAARVGQIRHEVDTVRELGSGGLPRILGAAIAGSHPWIATDAGDREAIDREMLRQQRPYSEKEVVSFLEDAARTLAPLHDKGVIHRGIRPDTLFRREASRIGLGLPAWDADLEHRPPDSLKIPYLAPEYAAGRATPRTDMYALGVTVLHLLTGLQGSELAKAARNPELREDRFGLTAGCFEIVSALLEGNTIKRVSSGGQLLALLDKANLEVKAGHGGGAAAAAVPGGKESGGLLDDLEGQLKAAGVSGAAASHFADRVRHDREEALRKDKKRGLFALLAALLALLGLKLSSLAKEAAVNPALRIKILVAMGLGVGAIAGGSLLIDQMLTKAAKRQELIHALPTPVVGQDDRAVANAEEEHKQLFAKVGAPAVPPPPVASTPLPADAGKPATDSEPGQPPPAQPPPAASEPPRRGPTPGPYDPEAEPGTDPEDASGLKKQSAFFIRVNKTYKTLTLYHNGKYATQYIVAIGARANTPDGRYAVKKKIANPSYENIPPGDSRNPLGTRWLGMDVRYPGGRSIGIHGTNNESSIGQAASGGCIRMKNSEVEQLFDLVPEGTPVEIN